MTTSNDTDLQYYLYMSDDWRGPYAMAQIRTFVKQSAIDEATYAYEPQHQTQLTVGDLLAGRSVMPQALGSQAASGLGSSGGRQSISDQPPTAIYSAKKSGRLDDAINALSVMRTVCFTVAGTDGRERDDLLDDLKVSYDTVREVLERLRSSPAEMRNFAVQIDKIATDIATRMADKALTAHLVDLRDCVNHADPDEIIPAAEAVLGQIAHLARTADDGNPFEIVDDEATPTGGHIADPYESARFELKGLQTDLSTVKDAYGKLQETYAKEQKQARRLVLQLKEQLESEQKSHEGDNAELRALAAEIHDLAGGCGLSEIDPGLAQDLEHLAEELKHTVPTSIVPVAESVLNRMVSRLDHEHKALSGQVGELSTVRAELLQLKTDMSLLRQREEQLQADKVRLQKQVEEERHAASRVDQSAKARESQFKSTVSALQVTKEIHQEVMEDLQQQLHNAQARVESMEHELHSTRDELKGTRTTFESRELALVSELDVLSKERSLLEKRQQDVSKNLKSAEAELAEARERVDQSAEDDSLAEALAAKVNQLRDAFESTRNRLQKQETNASALQHELSAARSEAEELRTRSDQLGSELDVARSNLDAARRRMEELQRAAVRLEAERSALAQELQERKGTDAIIRSEMAGNSHLQGVVKQLEDQVASAHARIQELELGLSGENTQAASLTGEHHDIGSRYDALLADREQLRAEIEALKHNQKDPATQRLRKGETGRRETDAARIEELEDSLNKTERDLREASEARSDIQAKLASVAAERDRMNGELTRLRSEHEAAAVEHRAAVGAARRAQTEAAARAAELQSQLTTSEAEQQRLTEEVEQQREALTENAGSESRLAAIGTQLATETVRADTLNRELTDHRRDLAAAQVRLERLSEELRESTSERERLASELHRRSDASAMRDAVDATGRHRLQDALDRLREQLEREQRRSQDLENRLELARSEARNAATRHADSAESYADAIARADRVASELAESRSRGAAELAEAERRLGTERDRARSLEQRVAEFDGRLAGANARHQTLERTIAELTEEKERLSKDASSAKNDKVSAEHQVSELTKTLRRAQADLADLQTEAKNVTDQRHIVSEELASTTGRHSRLAVTVDRLNKELATSRSQLESAHAEHSAALNAVKVQLERERATIEVLQTRIGDAERERTEAIARSASLETRLDQSDQERAALLADTNRLRQELEHTAGLVAEKTGATPEEVAQLSTQLQAAEQALEQAREDLETASDRGASRIVELEAQLTAEQQRLHDLEPLREQLRTEAGQHAEARSALAAVTAMRDQLQGDLERLRHNIAELTAANKRTDDLEQRLENSESQLREERAAVARLETDLAMARSQFHVAQAGREGLETSLAKVVADRERLLSEVSGLRRELDGMRAHMRAAGPEQSAELAAVKQMLSLERDRVKQLEERLADAWRKQGETMAMTDSELRQRLDRASTKIEKLKTKLRDERRRTEDLQTQVTGLRRRTDSDSGDSDRSDRSNRVGSTIFTRRDTPPGGGQHEPHSFGDAGDVSSPMHAAVDAFDTALEPGSTSSGSRPSPGVGSGTRNSGLEAGGFVSAFGRQSVNGPSRVNDLAPVLATLSQSRGSTLIHRRHKKILGIAAIVAGICGTAIIVAAWIGSLFIPCGQAQINTVAEYVAAPQQGRLEAITRIAGEHVAKGESLATIDGRDRIRTSLEAQKRLVEQHEKVLAESDLRADKFDQDIRATEDEIGQQKSRILAPAERRRDVRWAQIDTVAKRIGELSMMPAEDLEAAVSLAAARDELTALQAEDELDRKRLEGLHRQMELDTTITSLNGRLNRLKVDGARARAEAGSARTQLEASRTRVAELDTELASAVSAAVTSPIDGVVVKWLIESDQTVDAKTPLVQLAVPDQVFIEALLPEDSIDHIHINDRVELELMLDGRRLNGTVSKVLNPGQGVDPGTYIHKTGVLRDRRYRAIITLDPGALPFLGQGVRVIILGNEPGMIRRALLRVYALTL